MSNVGKPSHTDAKVNSILQMQPSFQAKSVRRQISLLAMATNLHLFQGNAGDTYGDTLYRNFMQLSATSCDLMCIFKYVIIM
ncbi:hypothetical protein SBA5_690021 [Candidatus Sulfotelmatomonas gaucii]|uniref:Uncharacterized protein n=1 Tax=Candidatus Sulfuritelmatomonas gaucii TaxID=2043161 RepID=A0A2N9LZT7_9BACT|nr:hypothetical protein SBA5_690021 [Candidatus Sulfotelmatomonas gaucii]